MAKPQTNLLRKMTHFKEIYSHIRNSYTSCIKNPLFILSSFFVDLLFFFLFGWVYSFFGMALSEHLIEVNKIIGEVNSQLAVLSSGVEDNAALSFVISQEAIIMGHVKSIAVLAAGITVSTYILWCIFQGINWHNASWLSSGKKTRFSEYLGRFSLLNLAWLFCFLLIGYLTYKLSIYNTMSRMALVGQNAVNYLMLVLFAVLFYFAVVSYSFAAGQGFFGSLKNSFVFGVKRAKFYAPAYILVAIALFVIYFMISLFRLSIIPAVLLNLLFMLPVLSYSRILFLAISAGSEKEGKKEN